MLHTRQLCDRCPRANREEGAQVWALATDRVSKLSESYLEQTGGYRQISTGSHSIILLPEGGMPQAKVFCSPESCYHSAKRKVEEQSLVTSKCWQATQGKKGLPTLTPNSQKKNLYDQKIFGSSNIQNL